MDYKSISNHCLYNSCQSGFYKLHSTEMVLLKVTNDIMAAEDGKCSAFDSIDHGIVLYRLNQLVGIFQSVLDWFSSYLADNKKTPHMIAKSHIAHACPLSYSDL